MEETCSSPYLGGLAPWRPFLLSRRRCSSVRKRPRKRDRGGGGRRGERVCRAGRGCRAAASRAPCAPPDMLLVPGGPFTMGADEGGQEDEHPAHTVTLAAFFLDRTEVTNAA